MKWSAPNFRTGARAVAALLARPALLAIPAILVGVGASAQPSPERVGEPAQAADYPPVYRVDVVVFAHAGGDSDRLRSPEPADFSGAPDPLLVTAAGRAVDAAVQALDGLLPMRLAAPQPDEKTPYLESESAVLRPIPDLFAALGEPSAPVARSLQRLLGSPAHEVLATRSWIQPAPPRRSTPALRIHDQAVVDTLPPVNPVAPPWIPVGLRIPVGVAGSGEPVWQRLFRPRPPRLEIYRLDGTARLRKRQFLHLDLDLVWQQRERGLRAGAGSSPTGPRPAPTGTGWVLHRMVQSRVVEPGRLEYFDSSRFGVLARIERFEHVVPRPETEPETDPEAGDAAPATEAPPAPPDRP